MKLTLIVVALLACPVLNAAVEGPLEVAPGGRYLQYKSGKPFFYTTLYLANRATKGFTVIQAAVLGQLGGLTVPNAYGDLPLVDRNPYVLPGER